MKPTPAAILIAILACALGLRLLGAYHGGLMYDEATHGAAAMTIDFRPSSFNLVWRSVDHPLLSVYVVRLSSLLFGQTLLGMRLLHVLFGVAGVAAIYWLGARVFSVRTGLWAAALLALDQFHITWSYFFVPEILLLVFSTLVFVAFIGVTDDRSPRRFVFLGVSLGMAYLAKETSLILFPILWITVFATPSLWSLLRDRRWYGAHLIALAVVTPDIAWNVIHWYEGYFYRDVGLVSSTASLSPRVVLLFVGDVTYRVMDSLMGFRTNYGAQNPQMIHWPAGLLYLGATAWAVRFRTQVPARLLLIAFGTVAIAFTLLPSQRGHFLWWWASVIVIPAVVFAGHLLDRFTARVGRTGWVVASAFLAYLLVHGWTTVRRPGVPVERVTAEQMVQGVLAQAREAETEEALADLDGRLQHVLHVAGPDPDLYALLSQAALQKDQPQRARYYANRSLALDASNAVARSVSEALR